LHVHYPSIIPTTNITVFHKNFPLFRFERVLTAKANKLWSKLKALSLMDGRGYLVKHPPSSFSQSGTAQLLPFSLS
jgi:hypothetical protein